MSVNRKLKPSPPPGLPLRTALVLGAGVTLAHLWLLGSVQTPPLLQARPPAPLSFSTRRIEPAPPAPPSQGAEPKRSAAQARVAPPPRQARKPEAVAAQAAKPESAARESPLDALPRPADSPPPLAEPAPQQDQPALPSERTADTLLPPAVTMPALALQLPGSVRLAYELSGQARGFNYSADAQLSWQQDGQRYQASLTISGLLLLSPRTSTSVGEIGPLGVAPRRFSDRTRSEQATHFQPEQGRIVFSSNAPQAPWQAGVQDRLSLFFQLAGMLAGDPGRFVTGAQVQVPTAGTREADTWTFTVTGTPTLALPIGEQATIALRREPRRPYDQTIELWFAPALGHLPVRIRIVQGNGDVLDQKLSSAQPL